VRHSTEGQRKRGDRLRTVGTVSIQPRHALPERRQALPSGLTSRPSHDRVPPRYDRDRRLLARAVCRRARARRHRNQPAAGRPWTRVDRSARRRESDDRKDVSPREVRPRLPADALHRLQRTAVHGQRRRRKQEGVRWVYAE
jgi:hypothetical protein